MKFFKLCIVMAIVFAVSTASYALDNAALVGKWQLVEVARDSAGKECPFVGKQIQFTADGKMISGNMPMPFKYKVNPTPAEAATAIARNPELKGMEIMLAMMGNSPADWSKAPIVYGVKLKDKQFIMKVSGYTPARYKKMK
ncbi:MAG: hypothetical protein PHY09_11860 [Desulfuromonadaceae bacterium]|nr:hypothetical protein [Desulfuromonadaceae bacterium]MDD5106893.1 hypothetical protein [Desulfuromonadaceae bacterium]